MCRVQIDGACVEVRLGGGCRFTIVLSLWQQQTMYLPEQAIVEDTYAGFRVRKMSGSVPRYRFTNAPCY